MQAVHKMTFPIAPWDERWFHAINGWTTISPELNKLAIVLAKYSPEIWAVVFLLLWFWPPRVQNRARRAVVYAVVSGVIAVAIAMVTSHLVYQARPFVADPSAVHQLVPHAADSGFPSDHATGSFAFAVALFFAGFSDGIVALLFAIAVALSRVMVGVHWPSDIIWGAGIGTIVGLAVLAARGKLEWLVRGLFRLFGFRSGSRRYRRSI